MGSDTLPLHSRKGNKEKQYNYSSIVPTSPKKILGVFAIILIFLYTFQSSQSRNTLNTASTSIDAIDYNINSSFWAPNLSDRTGKSAYPKNLFSVEALRENDLNPISAVILRVTDDDESIVYTIKHLLKYHFITEIYIYNHIKSRPLTIQSLQLDSKLKNSINIEILESDEQLESVARFTTCATAASAYCYFQDDTYLNTYMDTLYTNFLRFPNLIHANAKPSHYQYEMKWRFYNQDVKLHAGYADFRYGAFVSRWKVQNFLTQLGKSGLSKDSIRQAEHYFAIWMNQYPWLLSNPPHKANGIKATDNDLGFHETLDRFTYDAARHLQRSLTSDQSETPQDYFERIEELPILQHRDVRSSCTNDKCLFMTNMDPFVQPDQVTFNYENITSISSLETKYDALSTLPPNIEWDEHSYQRVVDSDPNTCWNTVSKPKKGDYFGLIIVGAVKTDKVIIHTSQEIKRPEKSLSVSVLASDNIWIKCKSTDNTIIGSHRISLGLSCPNIKYFRAIKVTFTKSQQEVFEICGLSLDTLSV